MHEFDINFPVTIVNATCFIPTLQLQDCTMWCIRSEKVEILVH